MNDEQILSDTQIFMQTIHCDECDESLFQISEVFEKDISIKCGECGARFTIHAERADEAITKNLLQQGRVRNQDRLSELLQIRLHTFEEQIGGYGSGAATLFQTYIETLFDAVIESVDGMILGELQSLFFRRISDGGVSSGPLLLDDIEAAATAALQRSDYELVDDERETED